MKTVVGLFDDYTQARNAAVEVERAGVSHNDISVLANNGDNGEHVRRDIVDTHSSMGHAVTKDAGVGAEIGGVLGALAGASLFVIPGLGWIAGQVEPIERTDPEIKIPHMGWNDVSPTPHHDGAQLVEPGEAYFLHSYHFVPELGRHIAAMTDHGGGLVAAVARDNLLGVQFHPEKSQAYGLNLLARFLDWRP